MSNKKREIKNVSLENNELSLVEEEGLIKSSKVKSLTNNCNNEISLFLDIELNSINKVEDISDYFIYKTISHINNYDKKENERSKALCFFDKLKEKLFNNEPDYNDKRNTKFNSLKRKPTSLLFEVFDIIQHNEETYISNTNIKDNKTMFLLKTIASKYCILTELQKSKKLKKNSLPINKEVYAKNNIKEQRKDAKLDKIKNMSSIKTNDKLNDHLKKEAILIISYNEEKIFLSFPALPECEGNSIINTIPDSQKYLSNTIYQELFSNKRAVINQNIISIEDKHTLNNEEVKNKLHLLKSIIDSSELQSNNKNDILNLLSSIRFFSNLNLIGLIKETFNITNNFITNVFLTCESDSKFKSSFCYHICDAISIIQEEVLYYYSISKLNNITFERLKTMMSLLYESYKMFLSLLFSMKKQELNFIIDTIKIKFIYKNSNANIEEDDYIIYLVSKSCYILMKNIFKIIILSLINNPNIIILEKLDILKSLVSCSKNNKKIIIRIRK